MRKRGIPVMNVGISLLILIFITLSLLTFSVLSLENAVADRRLSEKAAEHTSDYYAAVGRVQERLAEYMETARENGPAAGEQVTFEEEVSAGQRLVVTIRLTGEEDTDGAPDGENEAEPAAPGGDDDAAAVPGGENETESAAPDEDDDAAAAPGYEVIQWQLQSDEEWEPDRSLDVYQ